jgi:hypothetical protein
MAFRKLLRKYSEKAKNAYESGGVALLLARAFRKARRNIFSGNNAIWFARNLSLPIEDSRPKIPLEIDSDFSKTVEWMKSNVYFDEGEEREVRTAIKSLSPAGQHLFMILTFYPIIEVWVSLNILSMRECVF